MKFFARNKKGDLSISVNAIVILIIAVVALGLILMFMQGMFKKAGGKIEQAIGLGELDNPPSIENPITLTPSEISLRVGSDPQTLILNFMSTGSGTARYCKLISSQYPVAGGSDATISTVFDPICLRYAKNQVNQYKIPLSASGSGLSTTKQYIETFTMNCYAAAACTGTTFISNSKQMVITVSP